MVDLTPLERQAIDMVIPILAEAVAEIGKDKSLDHYSREEIVRLMTLCISEYPIALLKLRSQSPYDEEVPF